MVLEDDPTGTTENEIDLIANNVTIVTCNATVYDFNGWQDIDADSVNATIYIYNTGDIDINSSNDNNSHYTNRSCGSCVQGSTPTEAICDCRFAVQYYANDTTWICNISVTDKGGTDPENALNFSRDGVDTATITKLLAIDTLTDVIDYGNLSVTEISDAIVRNFTNVGNVDLNLTLRGFGGENSSVTNDSFAMICEFGNISFGYHKYAVGLNVSFAEMKNLTGQTRDSNFTLPQRTNDNLLGTREDINETFWKLEIPLGVGGLCNGTIIFGAVESG